MKDWLIVLRGKVDLTITAASWGCRHQNAKVVSGLGVGSEQCFWLSKGFASFIWSLFLLVSGLESPASESRITASLKVICCVLRAPVGGCVNAEGLMETGKGRKNRNAGSRRGCPAACDADGRDEEMLRAGQPPLSLAGCSPPGFRVLGHRCSQLCGEAARHLPLQSDHWALWSVANTRPNGPARKGARR